MAKAPSKKVVEEAIAALDSVRREWLRRPGVTAVDVGFKIKGDTVTDEVAIRVHVARKIPVAELASSEVFNETGKTPKKIKGFPVDVIEAKYGPSAATASEPMVLDDADEAAIAAIERTTAFDPLIGGISCGNPRVTAGTIGAIVFDRSDLPADDPVELARARRRIGRGRRRRHPPARSCRWWNSGRRHAHPDAARRPHGRSGGDAQRRTRPHP